MESMPILKRKPVQTDRSRRCFSEGMTTGRHLAQQMNNH